MKKILFFITVTASLFIIKDLVYSIYTLWHKNDLLIVAQKELIREKEENVRLKMQLEQVQKADFIEKQARNELFMVKNGEKVVIMPSIIKKENGQKQNIDTRPNWRQWLQLFFPELIEG